MKLRSLIAMGAVIGLTSAAHSAEKRTIDVSVTEKGFEPKAIDVKAGTEVTLNVTRRSDSTCATQIQVPPKIAKTDLPLNKSVKVALGKLEKGEVRFGCGLDMMEAATISAK